jgi:hypothetical protein
MVLKFFCDFENTKSSEGERLKEMVAEIAKINSIEIENYGYDCCLDWNSSYLPRIGDIIALQTFIGEGHPFYNIMEDCTFKVEFVYWRKIEGVVSPEIFLEVDY